MVPSSVVWVMLTASGWARCSSPQPHASVSMSSGVSLPSGVFTVRSLRPATRSGAAFSSVWMCAVVVQTTAPQRGSIDCRLSTFAPVPLNTGKASACSPKCSLHDLLEPRRVDVFAVGDLVPAVRGRDRLEHRRVRAGVVVTGEAAVVEVMESWEVGHGIDSLALGPSTSSGTDRSEVTSVAVAELVEAPGAWPRTSIRWGNARNCHPRSPRYPIRRGRRSGAEHGRRRHRAGRRGLRLRLGPLAVPRRHPHRRTAPHRPRVRRSRRGRRRPRWSGSRSATS